MTRDFHSAVRMLSARRLFGKLKCLGRIVLAAPIKISDGFALAALFFMLTISVPAIAQAADRSPVGVSNAQDAIPPWFRRGMPGPGQAALEPLIGTWRLHKEVYATLGRSPDEPPIISDDLTCRREWIADGRFIQDTTEGTVMGTRYWRRGWLGYGNMDARYDWVTVDAINATMMVYHGKPGSGVRMPISMSGVFTDQGVSGEHNVGKSVGMRTVIRVEDNDHHTIELYFTPPNGKEVLADRTTYTRINE